MKTLILLILVTITHATSQKEAATTMPIQKGQPTIKECQLPSTEQSIEVTKYNSNQEMPNNWNVKIIEW
jgi:hypothetical protein